MCMVVSECVHVYTSAGACGHQQRVSDDLELEVQAVFEPPNVVLCKSRMHSDT